MIAQERAKRPKPRKRVELLPEKGDVDEEAPVVYMKLGASEEWNIEAEKQQKKV